MNHLIKLTVDYNNTDKDGCLRLIMKDIVNDLKTEKLKLVPGMEVLLDDMEGLITIGVVEFSESEQIWVARIDWSGFKS